MPQTQSFSHNEAEKVVNFLKVYYLQMHGVASGYSDTESLFRDATATPEGEIVFSGEKKHFSVVVDEINRELLEIGIELELNEKGGDYRLIPKGDPNAKEKFLAFTQAHLSDTQHLSSSPVSKKSFYQTPDHGYLSPNGVALVLDYHSQKSVVPSNVFIVTHSTEIVDSIRNIHANAPPGYETEFLWFDGSHWSTLKIEKDENNHVHIMHLDSLGPQDDLFVVLDDKHIKPILKDISIYRAVQKRQGDSTECTFFAIKDARKLSKGKQLHKELQRRGLIAKRKRKKKSRFEEDDPLPGARTIEFNIPPRFMHVIQSRTRLHQYLQKVKPTEAESAYWKKKGAATLEEYAFLERDKPLKSRVKTGGRVNTTVSYFRDKYVKQVVAKKLEQSDTKSLHAILKKYNAKNLTHSFNQSVSKVVEESAPPIPPITIPELAMPSTPTALDTPLSVSSETTVSEGSIASLSPPSSPEPVSPLSPSDVSPPGVQKEGSSPKKPEEINPRKISSKAQPTPRKPTVSRPSFLPTQRSEPPTIPATRSPVLTSGKIDFDSEKWKSLMAEIKDIEPSQVKLNSRMFVRKLQETVNQTPLRQNAIEALLEMDHGKDKTVKGIMEKVRALIPPAIPSKGPKRRGGK